MTRTKKLINRRPAETATGAAGALVGLLALVLDLDGQTVAYMTILIGALPTAISHGVDWVLATRARLHEQVWDAQEESTPDERLTAEQADAILTAPPAGE